MDVGFQDDDLSEFICGATLVSGLHAVTAAHCVAQRGGQRTFRYFLRGDYSAALAKYNINIGYLLQAVPT
jgi:V8-like Glu-specific endopeptidase